MLTAMNIEIANRLLTLRKQFNFSQEELAERLGISRQAVSRWERAEASPDTDNLIGLSKLYGVSIDSLLALDTNGADSLEYQTHNQAPVRSNNALNQQRDVTVSDSFREDSIREDDAVQMIKFLRRISPAYPVIVTMIYLILGFTFRLWHPGWLVFLTIPIFYIYIFGSKFYK